MLNGFVSRAPDSPANDAAGHGSLHHPARDFARANHDRHRNGNPRRWTQCPSRNIAPCWNRRRGAGKDVRYKYLATGILEEKPIVRYLGGVSHMAFAMPSTSSNATQRKTLPRGPASLPNIYKVQPLFHQPVRRATAWQCRRRRMNPWRRHGMSSLPRRARTFFFPLFPRRVLPPSSPRSQGKCAGLEQVITVIPAVVHFSSAFSCCMA